MLGSPAHPMVRTRQCTPIPGQLIASSERGRVAHRHDSCSSQPRQLENGAHRRSPVARGVQHSETTRIQTHAGKLTSAHQRPPSPSARRMAHTAQSGPLYTSAPAPACTGSVSVRETMGTVRGVVYQLVESGPASGPKRNPAKSCQVDFAAILVNFFFLSRGGHLCCLSSLSGRNGGCEGG